MAIFGRKKEDNNKAGSAKSGAKKDTNKKSAVQKEVSSMKDLYEENKTTAEKTDKKEKAERKNSIAYRVLVKPLITEKATHQGIENKYVFAVSNNANKIEIAKAINEVYGIKPLAVNIVNVLGKNVRHGKTLGKRKDWKKAIVTLPKGKTINIYEGV